MNGSELLGLIKGWPGVIMATIGLAAVVFGFLGIGVTTPSTDLEEFKTEHTGLHNEIEEEQDSIHIHLHEQQTYMRSILRGECLESTFDKLARQGLATECAELGISRERGDAIDQELEND